MMPRPIDLKIGYWQTPRVVELRSMTAFSTLNGGHFKFVVKSSAKRPGHVSAYDDSRNTRLLHLFYITSIEFCICYLDDIIVHSKDYEEHAYHIVRVFERM